MAAPGATGTRAAPHCAAGPTPDWMFGADPRLATAAQTGRRRGQRAAPSPTAAAERRDQPAYSLPQRRILCHALLDTVSLLGIQDAKDVQTGDLVERFIRHRRYNMVLGGRRDSIFWLHAGAQLQQ